MNQSNTKSEREHIEQALPYSCVALCKDCHQGSHNGWHGRRAIWKVKKMQEIHALSVTIERLLKSR
jgi:hypothetical protein